MADLSDIQSESGVIGTLMYHPDYILHTDYLSPSHFYGVENGSIYWAIQELYKEGITNIDAYNISTKIQSHKGVQHVIDKYNVPSIQECMILYQETARHSLEEFEMLAQNIVSLSFKRELVKSLGKLQSYCYNSQLDLDKLSNVVYDELDDLTQRYITSQEILTLGESIDDIWQEIESRRSDDGVFGIPSKYESFSRYFTYEPGEMVVLQARYKQGKSVFLMNEVVHKLDNGVPSLIVDSEMPTRLWTERLISHLSGVTVNKVKSGQYSPEEADRIRYARDWIKNHPFVHIYDPNMSDEKLYSLCKVLKRKIGLEFVCYDYIKSNETSTSDNYNLLGARCDFLKNEIAGHLDLAVLAACQLNRNGEVADSDKINRYLSVGIKWGFKSQEMLAEDGVNCGNSYAKIYVNRLGMQMLEDDPKDYIDFSFNGDTMTIVEAEEHSRYSPF